ncbi:uncharacterized protein LOC134851208 [Symsagittifera roscoffensis]|uniref:uncharacterized protein LOC134851208 n=1 Tax=Symsagittifera roscoffensis TaxID=84072 RepID=UPI00307B9A0C
MHFSKALRNLSNAANANKPIIRKGVHPKFAHLAENAKTIKRLRTEDFTIDCTRYQKTLDQNSELKERVSDVFKRIGLVVLDNTGTRDPKLLKAPFKHILKSRANYEGGSNYRRPIGVEDVYDTGVTNEQTIHYHHEMGYSNRPPLSICFMCLQLTPGVDGFTYFCDNTAFTRDIEASDIGQKLIHKGTVIIRRWADEKYVKKHGVTNYLTTWQLSFMTDDPKVAEERAREQSQQDIEWCEETGTLSGRVYPDIYEYCPHSDRNLFWFSMADHAIWFDTHPQVNTTPDNERPHILKFGDGSDLSNEEVSQILDISANQGFKHSWKPGQSVLSCNYRFMHGRPGMSLNPGEVRQLGVVLGERFERVGPVPGKYF